VPPEPLHFSLCYYIITAVEVCPHPIQILYLVHYIWYAVLNSPEPQIQPNNNLKWNPGITLILAQKLLYVLQLYLLLKLYFLKKQSLLVWVPVIGPVIPVQKAILHHLSLLLLYLDLITYKMHLLTTYNFGFYCVACTSLIT